MPDPDELQMPAPSPEFQKFMEDHLNAIAERAGIPIDNWTWRIPGSPPPIEPALEAGQQLEKLFLTTSTGQHIEARVQILFHPLGRYELKGERFDVLFPDIALDPSLIPPSQSDIYGAIFGCFTSDEITDDGEKLMIGYPRIRVSDRFYYIDLDDNGVRALG